VQLNNFKELDSEVNSVFVSLIIVHNLILIVHYYSYL